MMVFEQTCSKRKASRGWGGVEKGRACAKPKAGVGFLFRVGVSSGGWWGEAGKLRRGLRALVKHLDFMLS